MNRPTAIEYLQDASFHHQNWAEPDLFLMVDEDLVESAENARLRFCPIEKQEQPVLLPTETWEGGDGKNPRPFSQDPIDGSVLLDARRQRFHLWYRSHNRLVHNSTEPLHDGQRLRGNGRTPGSTVCYATSADGLVWEKPEVGTVLFDGSYHNNMVDVSPSPVLSDHLSGVAPNLADPERGKLVGTIFSRFDDPIYPQGIAQLYSDDGIHWTVHFPPTLSIDGDAHCLMWDPRQQCYLCTTRSAAQQHLIRRLQLRGMHDLRSKRHVALARSRDLVHWTPMLTVLDADDDDPPNAQLYYMYIVPYGHLYLGFVQMFYMSDDMTYGPLDMQLAISRNGMDWQRTRERLPILPRGEAGSWDQSHVSLFTNPPHPEGDRIRFWYGGKDTEHWQAGHAGMGTGTLRRDGFACWEAGPEGGTITTAPLEVVWSTRPMLNVDARNGEARLEILGENGEPLEGCAASDCQPITGDHLRAMVAYGPRRGTFVRHTGTIRFRVYLRNAKLYAIKAPDVTV